jgi:TRL-like protein family
MKKILLISLFLLGLNFQNCSTVSGPVPGLIYNNLAYTNYISTEIIGSKKGTTCAYNYLAFLGIGDARVTTAASIGGINKITHVEHRGYGLSIGYIVIYNRFCVDVYGEYISNGNAVSSGSTIDTPQAKPLAAKK